MVFDQNIDRNMKFRLLIIIDHQIDPKITKFSTNSSILTGQNKNMDKMAHPISGKLNHLVISYDVLCIHRCGDISFRSNDLNMRLNQASMLGIFNNFIK
jgi:hypothetical protein